MCIRDRPTRSGRTGLAFTWKGKVNLKNSKYQNDISPLDENCPIRDLNKYSKSYLNHLVKSNEMMHQCLFPVSYKHLRAHETKANIVCRLLLEKKKKKNQV